MPADKAGLIYCQGWDCVVQALAHPNAPGWGQAIGSVLAIVAAIWIMRAQVVEAEKRRIRDKLEIRTAVRNMALEMAYYISASQEAIESGGDIIIPCRTSRDFLDRYAAEIEEIKLTTYPNAALLITFRGIGKAARDASYFCQIAESYSSEPLWSVEKVVAGLQECRKQLARHAEGLP